eukprot:s282_g33.t1
MTAAQALQNPWLQHFGARLRQRKASKDRQVRGHRRADGSKGLPISHTWGWLPRMSFRDADEWAAVADWAEALNAASDPDLLRQLAFQPPCVPFSTPEGTPTEGSAAGCRWGEVSMGFPARVSACCEFTLP